MERRSVASRGVEWVRYDEANRVLEVKFASGNAYRYLDVPPSVFDWLLRAESKGKFVNRLVKDRYAYERIEETHAPHVDLGALLNASIRQRAEREPGRRDSASGGDLFPHEKTNREKQSDGEPEQ